MEGLGWNIYQTDGTAAGTSIFRTGTVVSYPIGAGTSNCYWMEDYGQLWAATGTAASIQRLNPLSATSGCSGSGLALSQGGLVFGATAATQRGLWNAPTSSNDVQLVANMAELPTVTESTTAGGTAYLNVRRYITTVFSSCQCVQIWKSGGEMSNTSTVSTMREHPGWTDLSASSSGIFARRTGSLWKLDSTGQMADQNVSIEGILVR